MNQEVKVMEMFTEESTQSAEKNSQYSIYSVKYYYMKTRFTFKIYF